MIAIGFKHALKPLSQKSFLCLRQLQKRFQAGQQPMCSLRLRYPAIKDIPKIDLILQQDLIQRFRHIIGAVFSIFKNVHISREYVLEFLMLAHIGDGARDVAIDKKSPESS